MRSICCGAKERKEVAKFRKELSGMNRIDNVFQEANGPVLNIYLTAGYPTLDATVPLAKAIAIMMRWRWPPESWWG